jgi:sorting and assembly machinery component 37
MESNKPIAWRTYPTTPTSANPNVSRFSSFVESRGQPLLDLYLYVTSQNYYANTSPAYGSLLQWPNQWILPPKLHAAAKARTDHLGLSSLDLQAMEDQRKRDHSAAVASGQIPANLIQKPQETVSKLLGRTAKANHFRLDALTADFFEPLEAMLAKKEVLLPADDENNPSSLDCLAIGYLSLALKPDLAFPWLRDAMRTKAPLLTAYAERMHARVFVALPWREPERISISAVGSTLLNLAADNTPFLSEIRANRRLKSAAGNESFSTVQKQALSQYVDAKNLNMWVSVASVIAGGAALVGYMLHVGLISISGHGEEFEEQEEEFEPADVVHMPATDFLGAL